MSAKKPMFETRTGWAVLDKVQIRINSMEDAARMGRSFTAHYVKVRMRQKSALANKPAKAQNVSNPETQGTT